MISLSFLLAGLLLQYWPLIAVPNKNQLSGCPYFLVFFFFYQYFLNASFDLWIVYCYVSIDYDLSAQAICVPIQLTMVSTKGHLAPSFVF